MVVCRTTVPITELTRFKRSVDNNISRIQNANKWKIAKYKELADNPSEFLKILLFLIFHTIHTTTTSKEPQKYKSLKGSVKQDCHNNHSESRDNKES
jgi:hypothetical protein